MEEILSTVNAEPAQTVDVQEVEQVVTDTSALTGSQEVAEPKSENKPIQSKEDNAKFAELRREYEAKAQAKADAVVARMYGDQGIFTEADLEEALAAQVAEEMGQTPAQYKAMQLGEAMILKQEQKESDIKAIIELAAKEGFNVSELPNEVLTEWNNGEGGRLVEIYKNNTVSTKEKTYQEQLAEKDRKIAEYEKALNIQKSNETNAQASTGGVGGNGTNEAGYISAEVFENNKGNKDWVMKNLSKITASRKTW